MNLGWLCISWRQPANNRSSAAARSAMRKRAGTLIWHLRYFHRVMAFKKSSGFAHAESGILRLNTKKESVAAGSGKTGNIEYRMVRLRKPVERQHPKNCCQ